MNSTTCHSRCFHSDHRMQVFQWKLKQKWFYRSTNAHRYIGKGIIVLSDLVIIANITQSAYGIHHIKYAQLCTIVCRYFCKLCTIFNSFVLKLKKIQCQFTNLLIPLVGIQISTRASQAGQRTPVWTFKLKIFTISRTIMA